MAIQSYQDLVAWQKAMDLVLHVYRATKTFPKEELYALTAQIRRAAVSIPANIAEGQGRMSTGEFKQFLGNARGSCFELQTHLRLARRLDYLDDLAAEKLVNSCTEVGRIINGLIKALKS